MCNEICNRCNSLSKGAICSFEYKIAAQFTTHTLLVIELIKRIEQRKNAIVCEVVDILIEKYVFRKFWQDGVKLGFNL